jgi:serine/threonine protein kinase
MTTALATQEILYAKSGRYEPIRLIGKGGFSQVYLSRHIESNTLAALKVFDRSVSSRADLQDFYKEAYLLADQNHPHIIQLLDQGLEEDPPFFALAYATNGSLRRYLQPGTPLPPTTILRFALQVADGLYYLHRKNIVHCDVKPENILLGPANEAWLSDFGIAQVNANPAIHLSISKGTAEYAAPEQIEGYPEPASDQYSLAALIYEWLSGEYLYKGTPRQICEQHIYSPLPDVQRKIPSLRPAAAQVLQKALAKKPGNRFSSVKEFAYSLYDANQYKEQIGFSYMLPHKLAHYIPGSSFQPTASRYA